VAPRVDIDDALVTEGDTGIVEVDVTLRLSEPSAETVSVDYSTSSATAISGSDFVARQGSVTFSPGAMTRSVTFEILGDIVDEPEETFRVNLSNVANATLDGGSAIVTIADNDAPPLISVAGTQVDEGQSGTTSAGFSVTLSDPSAKTAQVDYYTVDGTALRDQDYQLTQGTLTFSPGQLSRTVSVPVIGDTAEESDETFQLILENPSNATIATSSATGTIQNDDTTASVSLSWRAPVTNVDGSCLDDLEGYRVHAGTESGVYTVERQVSLASGDLFCEQTAFDASCSVPVLTCTYVLPDLTPGSWFFSVQAYDTAMNHGPYSNEAEADIQ
jgi:hypothetical protein